MLGTKQITTVHIQDVLVKVSLQNCRILGHFLGNEICHLVQSTCQENSKPGSVQKTLRTFGFVKNFRMALDFLAFWHWIPSKRSLRQKIETKDVEFHKDDLKGQHTLLRVFARHCDSLSLSHCQELRR